MHKLSFILFLFSTIALAQLTEQQQADARAIADDLVYLADEYVSTAAEASVYQSSGGWFTSAKKKELWDLEISLHGNLLFIPKKSKNFIIDEAKLQNLSIQGDIASTPTSLGGDNYIVLEGSIGDDSFEFDSPEGINESYVRHAQLQASLGLWKGTTLIGRYSPKIKINKTYYQIVGLGIQHNISQWFPSIRETTFNLAGLVSYSSYSVSDTFSEVNLPLGTTLSSVVVDGESFMFNLVASKQFKKFIVSSAVGLTSSKFDYIIGGDDGVLRVLSILNKKFEDLNKSKTNFKADIGVDYSFYDFSVNTMLTFGNYTNLIFGINYNL